jgi:hypothetical protein
MAHQAPDFETKDVLGKTYQYTGSVTTTEILLPSTVLTKISDVLVRNPDTNGINDVLLYNFDGTSNYFRLKRGEFVGWTLKAGPSGTPITQISIKSLSGTINYEVMINLEP